MKWFAYIIAFASAVPRRVLPDHCARERHRRRKKVRERQIGSLLWRSCAVTHEINANLCSRAAGAASIGLLLGIGREKFGRNSFFVNPLFHMGKILN
jgi:hypothetical protein